MTEQAKRVNFLVIHILTLETRAGKTYTHKRKTKNRPKKNQTKLWNAFSYLKNGGKNICSESITEPTEQCSVKEFNWMSVGSQSVSCLSICWKKKQRHPNRNTEGLNSTFVLYKQWSGPSGGVDKIWLAALAVQRHSTNCSYSMHAYLYVRSCVFKDNRHIQHVLQRNTIYSL